MAYHRRHTIIDAFRHAFNGLFLFFKTERNGRIELACTILVIGLAFFVQCNALEWISILFCIAFVIGMEMINSAIEKFCDMQHPGFNKNIQYIKDVSAAAVLTASIISIVVAAIIFFPKIRLLFH